MSVLIDIKMPDCCARCPCYSAEHGLCDAIDTLIDICDPFNPRPDWCPLKEVPPHGRLKDADELLRYKEREVCSAEKIVPEIRYVIDTRYIKDAPTIIPAEEVDDERND